MDMTHIADYNQGYRHLLTVIDVFSKYTWVIPLKRKDLETVSEAFNSIFTYRKPIKPQMDKIKKICKYQFSKIVKKLQHLILRESK